MLKSSELKQPQREVREGFKMLGNIPCLQKGYLKRQSVSEICKTPFKGNRLWQTPQPLKDTRTSRTGMSSVPVCSDEYVGSSAVEDFAFPDPHA